MNDYPPGSFGAECERLDAQLARIEANSHGLIGWFVRRRARRARVELEAVRERVRERSVQALIDWGYVPPQ